MSLISLINRYNSGTISDDDGTWRQFVLDHADYIKTNSQLYEITESVMNIYKYDLRRFLKEKMGRNEDVEWIFLIINDLKSDFDFDVAKNYYIPADTFMINLYTNYQASLNQTF